MPYLMTSAQPSRKISRGRVFLYAYTLSDKKRSGNLVNLILPKAIGDCRIVPTPVSQLQSFIEAGL